MNKPVIGFAGMGHLGQHSAAASTMKGFDTIVFDEKKDRVEDLRQCDIVYISPDRPGDISPDEMVKLVLPHLRESAALVILCQVVPGFTRGIIRPRLYYQVETLRMKDAMDRALNPEQIIIGTRDGAIDSQFLQFLKSFACPILPMTYESAELAKIAINVFLASQVCTTNTLAEVANKIGADWNQIIPALRNDKRIGKFSYLEPGYGLSQHLERDLRTIYQMPVNTIITDTFLAHSEYRKWQKQ